MTAPVVKIIDHPLVSPYLVKCDSPCVISAQVTGDPKPDITWYMDCGDKVVDGDGFQIQSFEDGRKQSLTINSVNDEFDKRLLTVYASNIHGWDTSMIDLKTFTVYPRYRAPDNRRIPATLPSSESTPTELFPRKQLSFRRQCHSVPRSLLTSAKRPSKQELVRSQTCRVPARRTLEEPKIVAAEGKQSAPIQVEKSIHPSRHLIAEPTRSRPKYSEDSNRSYDSGIGDIARQSLPPLQRRRTLSSVEDVFIQLNLPENPAKTSFGESYELRPDDTPIFVDMCYSRPFPGRSRSTAEATRTSTTPIMVGKGKKGRIDSGRADLGKNLVVMTGKKLKEVCPEIVNEEPERRLERNESRISSKKRNKKIKNDAAHQDQNLKENESSFIKVSRLVEDRHPVSYPVDQNEWNKDEPGDESVKQSPTFSVRTSIPVSKHNSERSKTTKIGKKKKVPTATLR